MSDIEAQTLLRRAIVEDAFPDQSSFFDDSPFGRVIPDRLAFERNTAVSAWMTRAAGRNILPGTPTWQAEKDALAQGFFKMPTAKNLSDQDIHGLIKNHIQTADETTSIATRTALAGKPSLAGLGELDAKRGPSPVRGIWDKYSQDYQKTYKGIAARVAPYRGMVDEIAQTLGGEMQAVMPTTDAFKAAADKLLTVPEKDRHLVISAIGATGAATPDEQRTYLGKLAAAMSRETETIGASVESGLMSAVYAGAVAESMGAGDVDMAERSMAVGEASRDRYILAQQIRQVADGQIDPITAEGWAADGLTLARMVPIIAATVIKPEVGVAVMTAYFRDTVPAQLMMENPGMTRSQADGIGMVAAPFMAGVEVASNLVPFGKMPAVEKFLQSTITSGVRGLARIGARGAAGTAAEIGEEVIQAAIPLWLQDAAVALGADILGVDWHERMKEIQDIPSQVWGPALVMSAIGAGGASIRDIKNGRELAQNRDLIIAQGASPTLADEIATASADGDWQTVDSLFQRGFKPKGEDAATAEQKQAAISSILTKAEQGGAEFEQQMQEAEVSISKVPEGWRVTSPDGAATFADHDEAFITVLDRMKDQELSRDDNTLRVFEEFSKTAKEGESFAISDKFLTLADDEAAAKASGDKATLDAIYKRAEITRKQTGVADAPLSGMEILGRSSIEFKEGVATFANRIYQRGGAVDMLEEKAESDAKRFIAQGRTTLESLRTAIQQVEQATGDTYLNGDTDTAVIEAYSDLARLYAAGSRRGNVAKAIQKDAREQRRRLKASGASITQLLQETLEFFRQVLKQAARLMKAKRAGKLGDIEQFLNESLGLSEQAAHVDAVTREAFAITGASAPSYSIALSERLDAVAAALGEQGKGKPKERVAILQRAQEKLSDAREEWEALRDLGVKGTQEKIETQRSKARLYLARREAEGKPVADWQRKFAEAEVTTEEAKKTYDKQRLIKAMRALDAVLSVLPKEIRGRVGGFIKLAELSTDGARAKEIERRFVKVQELLEKHFQSELTAQVEKLFERYRPERKSGEKPKGKLDPDVQELVDAAEAAMSLTAEAAAGRLGELDTLLSNPDITPQQEVHLERMRSLVELFGDWKGADAARMSAAVDALTVTASAGWAKWKMKQLLKREARQEMRDNLRGDTGKTGIAKERDAMLQESAKVIGKSRDAFLNLSSFSEVLKFVFGQKSKTAAALVDAERIASNQYEDAIQTMAERVQDHFTDLAGGVLKGEQMRFDMSQPKITAGTGTSQRTLSELQAIQALLMWQQEDGKRHMMGPRDESNQPLPGKWSYDQGFIDELTAKLPPRALRTKAFLEGLYGEEYGPLNTLYRERHGVNLPRHDMYAPITVAPQQAKAGEVVDPVSGAAVSGSVLTPGALRSRNRTAVAEPRFEDALATLIGHHKQMQHWMAYYDFAVEAQAVMGNREVMNSAEAAAGKEAVKMLRKWTEAFAQGGMRDAGAGMALTSRVQRMASRAAVVGLLGRVSTLLVQSTQLAAASVQMPTGAYMLRLSKLLTGNLQWGDAIRSEFIQRRIKTAPPIVQQAMANLGTATRPNQITSAVRFLGNLLSGADGLFTGGTYAILLDYHRGTAAKMGLQGAEAEAFAHQEATRATEEVAQPVRMGNRSMMEITMTNPFAKAVWAYSSEARQKIALMAWAKSKGGGKQVVKTAFLTFIVGGLMSQVIKNLWREMKGDDDERKWSAERLAMQAMAGPLHGVPLVSELSGNQGLFSAVIWAGPALEDLFQGEADLRDINTILAAAGYTNDTLAGMAALSNAGLDFAQLLTNAATEE